MAELNRSVLPVDYQSWIINWGLISFDPSHPPRRDSQSRLPAGQIMRTAHEEYLRRRHEAQTLPLTSLHHTLMDAIFEEFDDRFTMSDAIALAMRQDDIATYPFRSGTESGARVIAIFAVKNLLAGDMIRELDAHCYAVKWGV